MDDSFVPKAKKPKPIPQSAPKPALKGKHVQRFNRRHKVGKGFYSVPVRMQLSCVQKDKSFELWCFEG